MTKKTKTQRNKKVKEQYELYEPQPFPSCCDYPLHNTYGVDGKGNLTKVGHTESESEQEKINTQGGEGTWKTGLTLFKTFHSSQIL